MTQTIDIRNWQVCINAPLQKVYGVEDIAQCVYVILSTVPGSDPLRPDFGSAIYKYIDQPTNRAHAQLIYAATRALEKWEKRIKVNKCKVVSDGLDGRNLIIDATVVASAAQITITFDL